MPKVPKIAFFLMDIDKLTDFLIFGVCFFFRSFQTAVGLEGLEHVADGESREKP